MVLRGQPLQGIVTRLNFYMVNIGKRNISSKVLIYEMHLLSLAMFITG